MTEIVLGASLVILYLALLAWHSPRGGKLTRAEIDHYIPILENFPLPLEELKAIVSRIRTWAEIDDGKPVYMFNLVRFFPELRTFPGAPEFKGTPKEANAYYEKSITWLWVSHAAYPIFSGTTQAKNLINMEPERQWGELAIARYRNQRTFLKLLAHPDYAPMEPYKFIALEIDLVPVSDGMVIPDLRWVVGAAFAFIFLLAGWLHAAWPH